MTAKRPRGRPRKPDSERMTSHHVRLPPELRDRVVALAAADGVSAQRWMRDAIDARVGWRERLYVDFPR